MRVLVLFLVVFNLLFGYAPSILTGDKMQKYARYYMNIGRIYADEGKYNNAIWFYKKTLKISPYWDSAYCNLGLAYYHIDEVAKALTMCKKAIYSNPKNVELYKYLGMLYNDIGEYLMAYKVYSKALEVDPKDLDSIIYLGDYYSVIKKDFQKSSSFYIRAIDTDREDYRGYLHLAYLHIDNQEYTIASELLKMAIELNPDDVEIYHTLFELDVLENRDFDNFIEKSYISRFKNQKDKFIIYEMLKIIRDIYKNREASIKKWDKKYEGVELPSSWRFDLIDGWLSQLPENDIKKRLTKAIYIFKEHQEDN